MGSVDDVEMPPKKRKLYMLFHMRKSHRRRQEHRTVNDKLQKRLIWKTTKSRTIKSPHKYIYARSENKNAHNQIIDSVENAVGNESHNNNTNWTTWSWAVIEFCDTWSQCKQSSIVFVAGLVYEFGVRGSACSVSLDCLSAWWVLECFDVYRRIVHTLFASQINFQ